MNQAQCFILVVNAWKVDNNCVALTNNFRFSDSERVNTVANAFDR